jgi:hypothetical protein
MMYNMHTQQLNMPSRKIVFPALKVEPFILLTRRYKCPVPPI